jgi:hypothetical protein
MERVQGRAAFEPSARDAPRALLVPICPLTAPDLPTHPLLTNDLAPPPPTKRNAPAIVYFFRERVAALFMETVFLFVGECVPDRRPSVEVPLALTRFAGVRLLDRWYARGVVVVEGKAAVVDRSQ